MLGSAGRRAGAEEWPGLSRAGLVSGAVQGWWWRCWDGGAFRDGSVMVSGCSLASCGDRRCAGK